MGFPDSYIIPVSDTQAYKQFGNSIVVPVVELIAKQVIDVLNRIYGQDLKTKKKLEYVEDKKQGYSTGTIG